MRLRWVWFSTGAIIAVLAGYYAGYKEGIGAKASPSARVAMAAGGEAERVRSVSPSHAPQNSIRRDDYDALLARDIRMPLYGIKQSAILDTFDQTRAGSKRHEATDIMAARGTPIHAVQDGTVKKLFLSKAGGNTIYEFDPGGIYCFYYAHLDRYADGLHEGMDVKKGDVIGYVGSTGDASQEAPHLHFAIIKLAPDKKWWQGTAINPYPILVQAQRR